MKRINLKMRLVVRILVVFAVGFMFGNYGQDLLVAEEEPIPDVINSTFRVEVIPNSGGKDGTRGEAEITLKPDEPYIDIVFNNPPVANEEVSITVNIYDPTIIDMAFIDYEGNEGLELAFYHVNNEYFSHTFTFIPEYSSVRYLFIWYFDKDHKYHNERFLYQVEGSVVDQKLQDFLDWMQNKGYSNEIMDMYANHSINPLVRREFCHYFSIRDGSKTNEVIDDFKNARVINITYHEIIPTDEGATYTLTDLTGLQALERYFRDVYGLEFQFFYEPENVDYNESFGPITYFGEHDGKEWIKLNSGKLNNFTSTYFDQRYYHILHFSADTLIYDGESMWIADWTGSGPAASFMDVQDYSSKYALGIYAHEWGHGIPLNHMFLSWESNSTRNSRFFGLDDIMVHSYLAYPQMSVEHRYTSPLARYALEPESPNIYVDHGTYVQDYNDIHSGSWMLTSDYPATKPLVRIERTDNSLVARAGGSFDRNSDPINYSYRWYQDGDLLPCTSNIIINIFPPCGSFGDVNLDGFVTESDATMVGRHVMGIEILDEEQRIRADVNWNGKVEMVDAMVIQQYIQGLKNTFPVCTLDTDNDGIPDYLDEDDDNDGFSDEVELYIGTDPLDACPDVIGSPGLCPGSDCDGDDAWPPDLNVDRSVDILDVLKFKPVINKPEAYNKRYDLNADGDIDILDVLLMKPCIMTSCE